MVVGGQLALSTIPRLSTVERGESQGATSQGVTLLLRENHGITNQGVALMVGESKGATNHRFTLLVRES